MWLIIRQLKKNQFALKITLHSFCKNKYIHVFIYLYRNCAMLLVIDGHTKVHFMYSGLKIAGIKLAFLTVWQRKNKYIHVFIYLYRNCAMLLVIDGHANVHFMYSSLKIAGIKLAFLTVWQRGYSSLYALWHTGVIKCKLWCTVRLIFVH